MALKIEIEREVDGRWIADIPALPGVMVYGESESDAVAKVKVLALRVMLDCLEHAEPIPDLFLVSQSG